METKIKNYAKSLLEDVHIYRKESCSSVDKSTNNYYRVYSNLCMKLYGKLKSGKELSDIIDYYKTCLAFDELAIDESKRGGKSKL